MATRRQVLRFVGALALTGGAGCVGQIRDVWDNRTEEWDPEVRGDEPELKPDIQTTINIHAGPIQRLQVRPEGETGVHDDTPDGPVEIEYTNVSIEPLPFGSTDAIPPVWFWGSQTDVSVELPVHVSSNAEAGEYPYSVEITEGGTVPEDGEVKSVTFRITVLPE